MTMKEAGKPRAVVAMSGGVDSSVAALRMLEAGYDCIGATMHLFHNEDIGVSRDKTCCSADDVADARSVAASLGMRHYVFRFDEEFRRDVMDRFAAAYIEGRTPNPCIDCNRFLKFDRLLRRAEELGYEKVATGHYARIVRSGDRFLLYKAVDPAKDQSYVLYAMTQHQLAHTCFPLGELTKEQVRRIAGEHGFVNAGKHDSQDICFVPDGDYAAFIIRHTGRQFAPGDFIDSRTGAVLGRHRGLIRYTIGQRKGLGLALPQPMYVCAKDLARNQVFLGLNDQLYSKSLDAGEINLIAVQRLDAPMRVMAKIRYRQEAEWATLEQTGPDRLHLEFDRPQRAVTPGQALVLYDGDLVVGGGTIL